MEAEEQLQGVAEELLAVQAMLKLVEEARKVEVGVLHLTVCGQREEE